MDILIPYYSVAFFSILAIAFAGAQRSAVVINGKVTRYESDALGVFLASVVIIVLGLFWGLRSFRVGADSYYYALDMGRDFLEMLDNGAIGYDTIVVLFQILFPGIYEPVFLFFALATAFFLVLSLMRYCPTPWVGLLFIFALGCLFEGVNQFRQLCAMSIALFAFLLMSEENYKGFVVGSLAAVSIHPSAIVVFLVMPLRKARISEVGVLAIMISTVAVVVALPILKPLFAAIPVFGSYVGSSYDREASFLTMLNFAFRAFLLIIVARNLKAFEARYKWGRLAYLIAIMGVFFQALTLGFSMFARVSSYFIMFFAFSIPAAIEVVDIRQLKTLLSGGLLLVFITLLLVNSLTKFNTVNYRYETFFSDRGVELRIGKL